ncbi:MAG: efflux RND transporter permease subunit, partial [Gammaproteobacteria bacterium]
MVKFTDTFIKRPVLAWVVSLLILLVGLRSMLSLPLQEYPSIKNTVITVTTSYPGAAPSLIEGFITSRLEKSVAQAEGIDYMTSQSNQGVSIISVYVKLNFDPNVAFTNVMAKVASVTNQLPKAAEQPIITQAVGDQVDLMYIGFYSKEMTPEQITEYVNRVIVPDIQSISGVSQAEVLGGSTFSMRIWLNPKRLASLNISPNEITQILATSNYLAGAGSTKGDWVSYNISAKTDLHNVDEFKNIIIKTINGSVVRLKDVAIIQLGAESYDSSVIFNGEKAVFIGIKSTPDANPLTVIDDVRKQIPSLEKQYPPELTSRIVYDGTEYVRASIREVNTTIFEAVLIVFAVIFMFLGAIRSVIIPVITIPLSLGGIGTLMLMMGFSLNLLTLLAMVLAIGLVVDDAIVVVENTFRHLEEGATPFDAAIQGAREIALPVISMTITLAAVYAPIGFMSGLTGALFKEFAFTLALTVIISGIVALTLSPMLCSRLLNRNDLNNRFVHYIDTIFERLKSNYQTKLHKSLNYRSVILVMAATVLTSCFWLFTHTPSELAPNEDQGIIFISATAPQYANIDYTQRFSNMFN